MVLRHMQLCLATEGGPKVLERPLISLTQVRLQAQDLCSRRCLAGWPSAQQQALFTRESHLSLPGVRFVLDSLLVSLMIVETWITPLVLSMLQISSEGMGDATILRLVRLLRLARMTRVAKLLRAFPEVLIMIKGLA